MEWIALVLVNPILGLWSLTSAAVVVVVLMFSADASSALVITVAIVNGVAALLTGYAAIFGPIRRRDDAKMARRRHRDRRSS